MKKKTIVIALSIFIIIGCLLVSCNAEKVNSSIFPSETSQPPTAITDESLIKALEDRISELEKQQELSGSEHQKELEALKEQLSALKSNAESSNADQTTTSTSSNAPFIYTVEENSAIITGYTGAEQHIVLPRAIDGYEISTISANAFTSKELKSIIITNGLTKIDWFAFENCTSLQSITIPSSVQSIGYNAFSNVAPTFTIYCHSGSFAHNYAQSYGISYAII